MGEGKRRGHRAKEFQRCGERREADARARETCRVSQKCSRSKQSRHFRDSGNPGNPSWRIAREHHTHGAMQLEASKKCVSYARDADVRAAGRSRAPMNSSERETQPNSAWITRSDAS